MKKALFVLSLFMVGLIVNSQVVLSDFSGTWNSNAEKSIQPQGDQGGENLVANQEPNLLTVERTRTGQDGRSATTTMNYTLDGKESINTSQRGDSISVANWSSDGKSLTIETSRSMEINGESVTMKLIEAWTLSDTKTLCVASTIQGLDGDVKTIMVYDKK